MAIHDSDAVVPISEQPKSNVHWYWLYAQLVLDNQIQRTISSPLIIERKRAVKNFYQTLPKEPYNNQMPGRSLAAHYNRKYEEEGLKESDLNWLMDGSLSDEYVYLAWLCIVRSTLHGDYPSRENSSNLTGFAIQSYVDSDHELGAKLLTNVRPQRPVIENQEYVQMGLTIQPTRVDELRSNIVDFLNIIPLELGIKREYVSSIKYMVESAKAAQWLHFAKGHGRELYEWLWCYLRGTNIRINTPYRMPGHISEYLNEFKYERLVAEFALWSKNDAIKYEIHEKIKKAVERKLRDLKNNATKIRRNFTISREASDKLDELSGGKGKGSGYLDRLIKATYRDRFN